MLAYDSATAEEPTPAGAGAAPIDMDAPPKSSDSAPRKASLRRCAAAAALCPARHPRLTPPLPRASYVESFDAETLAATARIVSLEGVALVERQTTGLFGSIEALQKQMADAIGQDVASAEDFMMRMRRAIADGSVDSLTLPYAQQRRVVLEAVAFGSFLRDVEGRVGAEQQALLTPVRTGGGA